MRTDHHASVLGYTSNLLFMRRRQAAQLLLGMVDCPDLNPRQTMNSLLDTLYLLPTECFIADDWFVILQQVTDMLLSLEERKEARMPTHLSNFIAQLRQKVRYQLPEDAPDSSPSEALIWSVMT